MQSRRVAGKFIVGLLAAGLAGIVQADITIQQQIDVDGFGPTKFGAMEGHSSTAISGNKSRTEQQTQFKSRLLRALAKSANTNTVRIVRLDAEVIDEIDVTNKQYSEMTFQQMRDATAKALQDAQSQPARQQQEAPSGAPVDDSKCQWSPPRSELKQTGEHASIAGTDTSRATVTVTTTCTDPTKGTSCDFVFIMDEYLAADVVPGSAETREFWRNYARKLNLTGDIDEMQGNTQAVFNRYKSGWGEAMKQAGSLKGFPLKTVAVMQFGGPKCKDDSSGTAGGGGSDSSSSSSVPTSPSAAIGTAALGLFNKMHKKDDSQQTAAAAPVAPGMVQMFQMSTETVAIRTDSIPGGTFDVPTGFKRVDKVP
jgi:hypothetical protein